jgi:hypothetical protein
MKDCVYPYPCGYWGDSEKECTYSMTMVSRYQKRIAYVQAYTLEGKRRQKRRYVTYNNSPLPTMEDKLLFVLMYLRKATTPDIFGEVFGMPQPVVNRWVAVVGLVGIYRLNVASRSHTYQGPDPCHSPSPPNNSSTSGVVCAGIGV